MNILSVCPPALTSARKKQAAQTAILEYEGAFYQAHALRAYRRGRPDSAPRGVAAKSLVLTSVLSY